MKSSAGDGIAKRPSITKAYWRMEAQAEAIPAAPLIVIETGRRTHSIRTGQVHTKWSRSYRKLKEGYGMPFSLHVSEVLRVTVMITL